MKFTFGCDPEFVLVNGQGSYSAAEVLPDEANAYEDIYHDNVMAEFQVPPATEKEEAVEAVRGQMRTLMTIMRHRNVSVRCIAYEDYTERQRSHYATREPTSVPERCAYKMIMIDPPDYKFTSERTAGGHIHIGTDLPLDSTGLEHAFLARLMDLFVGIPAAYINHDKKHAVVRNMWYGMPGSYRETEYGIEYRTLSNFWLASPILVEFIYDLTKFVVEFYENGGYYQLWSYDYEADDNVNPALAHTCTAYNVVELWLALRSMDKAKIDRFNHILLRYLPKNLYQRMLDYSTKKHYNPYAEWSI